MADLGRTAGSADVAAHAVKGSVRGLFVFTPLSIGDVLHNIESLGAAFSAGIAANAAKDFRIQLTHDIVAGLDFINVKGTFIDGEGVNFANAHALFHLSLAGKHNLQLGASLDAIDYSAGAAKATATATTANQLEACVFHGVHDGQGSGHGLFFTQQVYCYHFFH